MKKFKKVFTSIIIMLLFIMPIAASTTAALTISGNVPQNINIAVDSDIILTGVDVSLGDSVVVGSTTVTERSNARTGYTVSVASANGWKLTNTGIDFATYVFSHDAVEFTPTVGDLTAITITDSSTKAINVEKIFEVTVTFPELTEAGDYSDTIIFTIAAK